MILSIIKCLFDRLIQFLIRFISFKPVIFGFIYSSTVAEFPKAIFVAAASFIVVALILVYMIRLPPLADTKGKKKGVQTDLVDERGRSKATKDLR